MTVIKSPSTSFTGATRVGPLALEFKDGHAQYEGELSRGVKAYLESNGYGIDGDSTEPDKEPEPMDPRTVSDKQIGTKLRDAAVDPKEGDFLEPTNAGKANPHGREVVSPEVHASQGARPVKAGPVHVEDTDKQDDAETEHTEQVQDEGAELAQPAGNASRDKWEAYAVVQGREAASLEDLSRDEIRDLFITETE